VEKRHLTTETVSGSSAIEQPRGFMKLLDRLERDDVLVVTKLDRLGRNSIDVQTTVNKLAEQGVRVRCLALGGVDLTTPAGKTMGVIAAVAQFEKDLRGLPRTASSLDISFHADPRVMAERRQEHECRGRTVRSSPRA
jgi:putative DNA-invertase from lambdoid prophage Rac